MRFLGKRRDSVILNRRLRYQPKGHNELLRDALVAEQHGFCAY